MNDNEGMRDKRQKLEDSIGEAPASPTDELPFHLRGIATNPWGGLWLHQLLLEGKSSNTTKTYKSGIKPFLTLPLAGEPIRTEEEISLLTVAQLHHFINPINGRIDLWRASLIDASPSTVNNRLAAVSHLLDWVGLAVPSHIPRPKKGERQPRTLTKAELNAFISAAQKSEYPVANIIVNLLLDTGIRVGELVNLNMTDIDIYDHSINIREGKGNKDRVVLYTSRSAALLSAWLRLRNNIVELKGYTDALLLNKRGGRLTVRVVQKMMDRLAKQAGVAKERVSPHVLRHHFAVGLLENGADLVSIQRLMGHTSIQTTRKYLDISDQTIREVYHRAQQKRDEIQGI